MLVTFSVNQKPAQFDGPPDVPLLWVVREHLGLTGSKFGCGIGACGACTMHIDGIAGQNLHRSDCVVEGRHVTTIEGLAPTAIIRCSAPGARSTSRSAATASPG